MSATISLTEAQIFAATRTVLAGFGLVPTNPAFPVAIVRGQVNRVPEPAGQDFIVMWPVARDRLAMNIDDYLDTQITGTIGGTSPAGSVLNISAVLAGIPAPGQAIYGSGVTSGCQIVQQLSGLPGGPGAYAVTPCAPAASQTLYCGTIAATQETEVTIQADVHGPASADNSARIQTLWRSQTGYAAFQALGCAITPLYTSDPRQLAFDNAEQQVEERWAIDLCMQANIAITTTMQFADMLKISLEVFAA